MLTIIPFFYLAKIAYINSTQDLNIFINSTLIAYLNFVLRMPKFKYFHSKVCSIIKCMPMHSWTYVQKAYMVNGLVDASY